MKVTLYTSYNQIETDLSDKIFTKMTHSLITAHIQAKTYIVIKNSMSDIFWKFVSAVGLKGECKVFSMLLK